MSIASTPVTVKNQTIGSDKQPGVLTTISGSTPRMLQGYYPGDPGDAFLGIKVSRPGVDVRTAADSELIMSSDFNMFKIIASGSIGHHEDISYGTGSITDSSSTSIALEDLGIDTNDGENLPIVVAFFSPSGFNVQLPFTELHEAGANAAVLRSVRAYILGPEIALTTTQGELRIQSLYQGYSATGDTIDTTFDVKYYILRETIN